MKTTRITLILRILMCAALGSKAYAQPSVLWTYQADSPLSPPAVDSQGTVYVGSISGLCAVTNVGAFGSNKWVYAAAVANSVSLGTDGVCYFGDRLANLRALNADGTQRWLLPLQPLFQESIEFQSTPALARDGTIHFVAGGWLFAVSPAGTINWHRYVEDSSRRDSLTPVVGHDGTIYVGSITERKFYAFSVDGTKRWTISLNANGGEAAAIAKDGTIYYTGGNLFALTPAGTILWSTSGSTFEGPPVVGGSGSVYVSGLLSHDLYAIAPGGQVAWEGPGLGNNLPGSAPAVDGAENIFYCVSNSVWSLDSQGHVQWVLTTSESPFLGQELANNSPTLGPDGIIYATIGRILFVIAGTNSPNSAWPMYQQNSRHTGKVEKPALNPPKKRADANFEFQLYAQLGQTNVIETTTNLSTWTALTNVVITNVPMDVVDLSASNYPLRFYRSLVP